MAEAASLAAVPDRIAWAVDVVDPAPDHRLIEIGCGTGIAAGLVCGRLTSGQLLAVDRSAVAVARTLARNADHVAAGRLSVQRCELSALDAPPAGADTVFAVNVNVFWTRSPARELAALRSALRPGGLLCALYGTGPTSGDRITAAVSAALRDAGYVDVTVIESSRGIGVRAVRP